MRIKQDLPTYNASIYLRTECSEREKSRGPEQEKNPQIKICIIFSGANSVRIAICGPNQVKIRKLLVLY